MSEKLLTISIAAYNVEKYIEETLDSLIKSKFIDLIEIFVVDDGGNDNTLAITNHYKEYFPNSIIPVHKENGGYGTTVNYSLQHSTGKYFKLLDGDDWVDTMGLDTFIEQLQFSDADVVVSPYLKGADKSSLTQVNFLCYFSEGKIDISKLSPIPLLGMWGICYKTSILKSVNLNLPSRLFYTDQIFCTIPFIDAKTIQYVNSNVYCYRIGRDGQSISKESRLKNIQMTLDICEMLVKFYEDNKDNSNAQYILHRVSSYYVSAIRTIMLLPITKENLERLKEYENKIEIISKDIYLNAVNLGKIGKLLSLLRSTNYYTYWLLKLIPNGMPNWG